MTTKVFAILGSGLVGFLVHFTAYMLTGSAYIATAMCGICAFSLGIAAGRDGIWR